ncbi:PREDICTED: uncharacterized protein LOC106815155, partial [Priapulus caudatus]|uniref:Uncharacterized protein LOC106815155 n=1 Tax=Priapulus caudatus TaxID=37621 RepID=A0ABM1ESA2_PRICU
MSKVWREKMCLERRLERVVEEKEALLENSKLRDSCFAPRNVNKKLARRDTKIEVQSAKIVRQEKMLSGVEGCSDRETKDSVTFEELLKHADDTCSKLTSKIEEIEQSRARQYSKVAYWKNRAGPSKEPFSAQHVACLDEIEQLKKSVYDALVNNNQLVSYIAQMQGEKETEFFSDGRYNSVVHEVYQTLVSLNVGTQNCEAVVRVVLNRLAGLKVGRLPAKDFARAVAVEARILSQAQVLEALENDEFATLGGDGTSKKGKHYGAFDIHTSEGATLNLGLRDMAEGDAGSYFEILQALLKDLAKLKSNDEVEQNGWANKLLVNIKNTMNDRHIVNKKLNKIIEEYRDSVLPDIIEGYSEMTEDKKTACAKLNQFYCGMHLIVNFATQANAALGVWERCVLGESFKLVGCASVGARSKAGESGAGRLIRTACKAVGPQACEKSGREQVFKTEVRAKLGHADIPLAPFRGNRVNVLFYNGGGLYHLIKELNEFFTNHKENKLLQAVGADLGVPAFVSGCRALGIVEKLITSPLWRKISVVDHIYDMNQAYQQLKVCLEKWTND